MSTQNKLPTSDVGTVILHWSTAIAFFVSLFTGLTIAADWHLTWFEKKLLPILPTGAIWDVHFIAGLTLFFSIAGYVIYMLRSGLLRRISIDKVKTAFAIGSAKSFWEAFNIIMHWVLFVILITLTVTGVLMYLGHGGILVKIHNFCTMVSIIYIFAHIIGHFGYGSWQQLIRVLNPAKLVATKSAKSNPLLYALLIGLFTMAAVAGLDYIDRDTLRVAKVAPLTTTNGEGNDEFWAKIKPVKIQTQQGANLGGTGESKVEVKAAHDGDKIYFHFKWEDPSRSLRRVPTIKKADGWHVLDKGATTADVIDFYEDKFSVIFASTADLGGGGVTHFGKKPLPDKPGPFNERGFHYTTDGSIRDVWQWKATREGHQKYVDDLYFGPPYEPSEAEKAGKARYQGGYWNDPGKAYYSYNYDAIPKGTTGPGKVKRLPKDLAAIQAAMGKFDLNPDSNDDPNGRMYMLESETEPYTAEADAKIPVGTVLPAVLIMGPYEGDRADIKGDAVWKDGYWTLKTVRKMNTNSKYDQEFKAGMPIYMWVGVFDHTQTRHSRHARAVRVVVE